MLLKEMENSAVVGDMLKKISRFLALNRIY